MRGKAKGPKMTVTSRFFDEKSREASRQIANPFPNPPPGRSPIARLHSHGPSPKLNWTNSDLATWITRALPGAVFFLDTGIFTRELDSAVWSALMEKRVAITPGVAQELLPWLADPFCNKAIRDAVALAVGGASSGTTPSQPHRIGLLAPGKDFIAHGYEYYVNLLALRKMMGPLAVLALTKTLGRAPTQGEFHREVQSRLGERGYLLAKKGLEAQNSPNKLTDEHLVVTSMLTAIMTGHEVVIMSRDPDVLEQYAKICTLMKEHYRAALAAELYASNHPAFAFERVPALDESIKVRFSGESVLRFQTTDDKFNPLPRKFHFVCVYCLLLGGAPENMKATVASFCAEIEMARALRIKASTGGLTTDKFDGRNCIILTEHVTQGRQKVIVLIGEERKEQFASFSVGVDDVHNTLTHNEVSMLSHFDATATAR